MQGTAADLIKLAMIAVQDALDREQRATQMIMQVHDELVFEVPDAELDWARSAVPRIMAAVATLQRCRCSPRSASARTGTRRTDGALRRARGAGASLRVGRASFGGFFPVNKGFASGLRVCH